MSRVSDGTIVITGPTGGIGKELVLQLANRPQNERPDLLLVGRAGATLEEITKLASNAGATAFGIPCDLSVLADVRNASKTIKDFVNAGKVRSLRAIVANAGLMSLDTRKASADGYELTFAVNYLAHALLITDLRDTIVAPGRIVLVGSNTYWQNTVRKILHVPPSSWIDPLEIAKPAPASAKPTIESSGVAYSNSKLAILYYAHELQRHVKDGLNVVVFEPGFMPGSGLSRAAGPMAQRIGQMIGLIPISPISTPEKSAPKFASVILDDKWSDGDYIVIDKPTELQPFARDRAREERLWQATEELLSKAHDA